MTPSVTKVSGSSSTAASNATRGRAPTDAERREALEYAAKSGLPGLLVSGGSWLSVKAAKDRAAAKSLLDTLIVR